jgi:predicted  nucleic acid-binding Zn-ribbon protein
MTHQKLAAELSLLATEADSVEKALLQAQRELSLERGRRHRAETQAEDLREKLALARKRAESAERELGKIGSTIEAEAHKNRVRHRELTARLEQAQRVNEVLQHDLEQTENERRALEENLQEVLGNLRHAAQKAGPRLGTAAAAEDATLVPSQQPDNGW